MIASDELFGLGHTSPETTADQHHLSGADGWCLMYPEIASEGNLVGIRSHNPSRSWQEDIIHDPARGSDDHLRKNPVLTNDKDAPPVATPGFESSGSVPLTSLESTLDDLIVVAPTNSIEKPRSGGTTLLELETKSKFSDGGDIAFINTCRSEEANCGSIDQASDITHESFLKGAYPMGSPETQVMERDDEYNPDRIPPSVFSRSDSLTLAEWSDSSNESLFSIQVGNASFSREVPSTSSGEFSRSGELTRANELLLFTPSLPTQVETLIEENDSGSDSSEENIVVGNVVQKDTGKTNPADPDKVRPLPSVPAVRSSSVSCISCDSEGSTNSFAFPILASGAQSNSSNADSPHQHHSKSQSEVQNTGVMPKASTTAKTSSNSCFYCFSCFSCNSWFACGSCRSCFSCASCCSFCSCFSCSSCWPRCC